MTSLGNQGVQTTRKDNKIIWNEGLDSDGQQSHHYIKQAIHCPLPAAKIRGPRILEVSPFSD